MLARPILSGSGMVYRQPLGSCMGVDEEPWQAGLVALMTLWGTGKVQRKHILLGMPGSQVAAVIVEGSRFAFVYSSTPPRAAYGKQQARLTMRFQNYY